MLFGNLAKLFDQEQDIEIICNNVMVSRGKVKDIHDNRLVAWLEVKEGCIKAEGNVIRFYYQEDWYETY